MSNSIAATSRSNAVSPTAPTKATRLAAGQSVLPAAAQMPVDPMAMLHALTAKQREVDTNAKASQANEKKEQIREAQKKLEEALEAAKKAEEDKGFFDDLCDAFNKVATVAAALGALASVVATGGASLPAVLALSSATMSALATANKELGIIKGDFGEALNTGLTIGAAGTGIAGAGCAAFGVGAKAAELAGQTARVAKYVATGAQLAGAASSATAAVAKGVAAGYAHDAAMHDIDAERESSNQRRLSREEDRIVKDARAVAEHYQRSIQIVLDVMGDQQRTRAALAQGIRG